MILWHARSPPFARATVSITDRVCGKEVILLAIVENKAERSGDRFERTEGTRGVPHPTGPGNSVVVGVVGSEFDFFSPAAALGSRASSGQVTSGP